MAGSTPIKDGGKIYDKRERAKHHKVAEDMFGPVRGNTVAESPPTTAFVMKTGTTRDFRSHVHIRDILHGAVLSMPWSSTKTTDQFEKMDKWGRERSTEPTGSRSEETTLSE